MVTAKQYDRAARERKRATWEDRSETQILFTEYRDTGNYEGIKLVEDRGICAHCGRSRGEDGTQWYCRKCANSANKSQKKRYKKLIEERLCTTCKKPLAADETFTRCEECRKQTAKLKRERRRARKANGVCKTCGSVPLFLDSRRCRECFFKDASYHHLGTAKKWHLLAQKWEDQGGKCAYTGEELRADRNTTIEHIESQSQHPELSNDSANVVWVIRSINNIKGGRDLGEFVKYLEEILDRCKKLL